MNLRKREAWRRVPSHPGIMASSWGRVRVEFHLRRLPDGRMIKIPGKPTYGFWEAQNGRFRFRHGGKNHKVHVLVCEAWKGPKPFAEAVVMHDDEDGSNNAPGNLIWGTQKENMNYPGFKAQAAVRLRQYSLARMQVREAA